ncbi:hypothetical protein Q5752_001476 [Cryptotrichosporon argae]
MHGGETQGCVLGTPNGYTPVGTGSEWTTEYCEGYCATPAGKAVARSLPPGSTYKPTCYCTDGAASEFSSTAQQDIDAAASSTTTLVCSAGDYRLFDVATTFEFDGCLDTLSGADRVGTAGSASPVPCFTQCKVYAAALFFYDSSAAIYHC